MSANPVAALGELPDEFARVIFDGALPGETIGLTADIANRIAAFMRGAAAQRTAGKPAIRLESLDSTPGRRIMALAIVNDDMPFLVDSVSAAIGAAGLRIERLLHPTAVVGRNRDGQLTSIGTGDSRESLIYIEVSRANARARAELVESLTRVLADVRAAVTDWPTMLSAMKAASKELRDNPPPLAPHEIGEAAAFLEWLAADNFTLLGYHAYRFDGDLDDARFAPASDQGLGLLRDAGFALWRGADAMEVLPEGLRRFMAGPQPLLVTKASALSTVHRRTALDYIGVKRFDRSGRVVGEHRFIGLYTSQALVAAPREIPILRRKVADVSDRLGFNPSGHAGKALAHILDTLPKDELLQVDVERLCEVALGLLSLLDRPRPKLFVRGDAFGRFVSALVYVPRDDYTGGIREKAGEMLERAFDAKLAGYEVELRGEGLARVHYTLTTRPGSVPTVDEATLDQRLTALVRGWGDSLETALAELAGAQRAARLTLSYGSALSPSYQAQFTAVDAADDILRMAALGDDAARDVNLYRNAGDTPNQLRLKIYRHGAIIPLSEAVPVLENFGFRVIEEFPFDLGGGRLGHIHDFLLEATESVTLDLPALEARVEPALRSVLTGAQENDLFNALVTGAGLDAKAVGLLRAYFRYLRQTGVTYGLATVVDALRRYPAIAADLVALFEARFDPAGTIDADDVLQRIETGLTSVSAIDDDRILRLYRSVMMATLRTNAYAPGGTEALAFKLESHKVPNLPPPVPYREIWVYSPRVEGIHLRGGPIARGGLRWSDRRDDFRTEVLGLVKAQMVKNAVIVPTGAKGGFYPKHLPAASNRDAWLAEGTESYRIFIRALLSVTDNLGPDGAIIPPVGVRAHDAPDPYLVVAADKGTATFSDIANAISEAHGFWLGDAFASGGRYGYDHKAMGITAKGAWVSVQRHFRELGIDVQRDPVRVIGVGDMSGDVFGNGMLLSESLKLVAAFDHRHIFLDPDPDPARSFKERQRLFTLPRSSWADYDASLISKGGGIFPRDQKSIPLSGSVQSMLGLAMDSVSPAELMTAILTAQADLAWFGGIGTYVKAASESNADVGDRANDAIRVNGAQLRVRVIGEGANLGTTQAGRIEFARKGGRINTDFIDNSAGVDTSDNEVNIKIALAATPLTLEERNILLVEMTDEVERLVLRDNIMQTQALSVAEAGGAAALPSQMRVIQSLEAAGRLNRAVEGLPGDDVLTQRMQAGQGLERPELAVLLAYAKMALKDALVGSPLVDDPVLVGDLHAAFPKALVARFVGAIDGHRLRRELIATKLANQIVNRGGIPLAFELAEELGASLAQVAGAFVAARELFYLRTIWRAIDASTASATVQIALHAHAIDGLRTQMGDLMRGTDSGFTPSAVVSRLMPGIERIDTQINDLLRPEPRAQIERFAQMLAKGGAPDDIASMLVRLETLDGAVGVARLATDLGVSEREAVDAYTLLGEALGLDWAKGAAAQIHPADPWERLLVAGLVRDFESLRLDLIGRIAADGKAPVAAVKAWLDTNQDRAERLAGTIKRARSGTVTSAMLAHLGAQARAALAAG